MGTPRPHVSRHVSGRAPRRGRRSRRPVFRSPIAGCTRVLHVCLRRPYSFQQRKKYGKERRQKPTVFGFPFCPIVTAVQKGSALDRLQSYPRCRSCVPRENFLLSRRTEEVLYILHTFIFCGPKGRTYLSQPAGKRHPFPRPAVERPRWAHPAHTYLAMSPVAHPVGAGVLDGPFSVLRLRAAPASCICLRRLYFFQQRKKYGKERRQKPSVFGFPFRPIVTAVQKGSAPNRLRSYPRCRSRVPRLNAPMGTPRPHVSRHVSGRAPRRGRRPRRPVFRSPIAGCTRVLHLPPAAIFLSTAKEIWKRTPPKTIGFWRRFCPLLPLLAKAGRSGERNVPAPRLRTKRYPSGSAGGVSQFT